MKKITHIAHIQQEALTLQDLTMMVRSAPSHANATEIRISLPRWRELANELGGYKEARRRCQGRGLPVLADDSTPHHEVFFVMDDSTESVGTGLPGQRYRDWAVVQNAVEGIVFCEPKE